MFLASWNLSFLIQKSGVIVFYLLLNIYLTVNHMSGSVLGAGDRNDRDRYRPLQSCGVFKCLTSTFNEARVPLWPCLHSCVMVWVCGKADGVDPTVHVSPSPTCTSFWLGLANSGYLVLEENRSWEKGRNWMFDLPSNG